MLTIAISGRPETPARQVAAYADPDEADDDASCAASSAPRARSARRPGHPAPRPLYAQQATQAGVAQPDAPLVSALHTTEGRPLLLAAR